MHLHSITGLTHINFYSDTLRLIVKQGKRDDGGGGGGERG